jgi:hypothetical protein
MKQEPRVMQSARHWILFATLFATAFLTMCATRSFAAEDGGAVARGQLTPSSIVIGFVGGFVRHDNPHHGPVILARQLRTVFPNDVYVQVFENRHRQSAYRTILRLLDRDHDGILSAAEKAQARIILYGQSWGASSTVLLARDLNRLGIPVLLTVQVDSVKKLWRNDSIIPPNVVSAVNFFQPHGIVRGRQHISAADPAHTEILGNYRFDYKLHPVQCQGHPWFDRFFTPGHMQTECDPQLWSQVEGLIRSRLVRSRLEPDSAAVAALPGH